MTTLTTALDYQGTHRADVAAAEGCGRWTCVTCFPILSGSLAATSNCVEHAGGAR